MTVCLAAASLQEPTLGAQFHMLIEDALVPLFHSLLAGEAPPLSWLQAKVKEDSELGAHIKDFADVYTQIFMTMVTAGDAEEVRGCRGSWAHPPPRHLLREHVPRNMNGAGPRPC